MKMQAESTTNGDEAQPKYPVPSPVEPRSRSRTISNLTLGRPGSVQAHQGDLPHWPIRQVPPALEGNKFQGCMALPISSRVSSHGAALHASPPCPASTFGMRGRDSTRPAGRALHSWVGCGATLPDRRGRIVTPSLGSSGRNRSEDVCSFVVCGNFRNPSRLLK